MSSLRLKIIGLVIIVAGVVFGVYAFWPTRLQDASQEQPKQTRVSNNQPKRQLAPEDFQTAANSSPEHPDPREQELRKTAA